LKLLQYYFRVSQSTVLPWSGLALGLGSPAIPQASWGPAEPNYLHRMVGDPVVLMDIAHPIIALELLVLATYHTASKLYGKGWAGWIALLASAGHSSLGFIAGGYQANSLALPLGVLLLSMRPGLASFTALQAMALIHPWTFAMYSVAWAMSSLSRAGVRELLAKVLAISASIAIPVALGEAVNRSLSGGGVVDPVYITLMWGLGSLYSSWSIQNIPASVMNIYYGYTLYA